MIVILFTASYPYIVGGEQNFLDIEVQYLKAAFDRVVLVPGRCEESSWTNPAHVEVDDSYANHLHSHNFLSIYLRGLFSPLFYQGLREQLRLIFSLSALRRLLSFAGRAELTCQWVVDWLKSQNSDGQNCLFYTYWFDRASGGIGLAKQQYPQLCLVSRAHGYDLYEEQYYNPPFWPCRRTILPLMDGLFPDSRAGTDYLRKRYPEFAGLYETASLGVREPGFIARQSQDGVLRIVSCSMLRSVKRVERLLDGIAHTARLRPNQRFEWHHFGNGQTRDYLQKKADKTFPPNARGYLPGYSDKNALMNFYKDNPIDVFVNLSSSEGIPVSIMEAISCGIPVIATKVGGNPEIVSEQNGLLISSDPRLEEIASALFYFIDHPVDIRRKCIGSREIWQTRFDADHNFMLFAKKLKSLRLEKSIRQGL